MSDPRSAARCPGRGKGTTIETGPWADLVMAILSVNNYPLDRTFALFEGLKAEGLFEPLVLAEATASGIARKLGAAGYNRGHGMTQIFTERLLSLGGFLREQSIEDVQRVLVHGSREHVCQTLGPIKGIGPRVLDNFFVLRGDA